MKGVAKIGDVRVRHRFSSGYQFLRTDKFIEVEYELQVVQLLYLVCSNRVDLGHFSAKPTPEDR